MGGWLRKKRNSCYTQLSCSWSWSLSWAWQNFHEQIFLYSIFRSAGPQWTVLCMGTWVCVQFSKLALRRDDTWICFASRVMTWKTTFYGWPFIEDDFWWKTPLMEEDLWRKRTFHGRRPLTEDDLGRKTTFWRKTTLDGRQLLTEDNH